MNLQKCTRLCFTSQNANIHLTQATFFGCARPCGLTVIVKLQIRKEISARYPELVVLVQHESSKMCTPLHFIQNVHVSAFHAEILTSQNANIHVSLISGSEYLQFYELITAFLTYTQFSPLHRTIFNISVSHTIVFYELTTAGFSPQR
jgi:hypothetical protein